MAVSYKKLFHLLIEKNMTNSQLQQEAGFSATKCISPVSHSLSPWVNQFPHTHSAETETHNHFRPKSAESFDLSGFSRQQSDCLHMPTPPKHIHPLHLLHFIPLPTKQVEIKSMLRDATKETEDMKIVEQFDISVIDTESLKGFRNHHKYFTKRNVNDIDF